MVDLAVLGAGPAGCAAACAAAGAGLKVVVLDEQEAAGGQIHRAPRTPAALRAGDPAGASLRADLARSGAELRFGCRVWSVAERFRLDALGPDGPETVRARALVAATGAHERVVPFPGWTRPGVIGLAAATVLLKTEGRVPGRRIVVAGAGPLLANVAAKIVAGGGTVAAIVDVSRSADWLRALPGLLRKPALLGQGAAWALRLAARRVPILFGHAVVAADGVDGLDRVAVAPVLEGRPDLDRVRWIAADLMAVGNGLVPGADVTKLLRAAHLHAPERGGWVPVRDVFGRTSVAGLYAVGDGAGVMGAEPAARAGHLAGLAVAHDLGRLDREALTRAAAPLLSGAARDETFSDAVSGLMRVRPGQVAAIAPDTVVCRCEDVTRAEIDDAYEAGARSLDQLKAFTRCGMGPCQGRMCGETAGDLLALRGGDRAAVGWWTGRPPLRPVALADLVGSFDYADIPVPKPAPL
ncbi:MAG: FAD-dependent oxidoreductase [Methylobacteriaceae bacterium]|nr:FAD-dependent oxidoreductase [Methylobacteriaceae bacterium]